MDRVLASLVRVFEGATAGAVGSARASVKTRRGVVLTLVDGAARVGQGEASPLPGYSRETLDGVHRELCGMHTRLRADALQSPTDALDEPWVLSLSGSARFALETALLDLVAQRRGVSLHALLGAKTERCVHVSAYIGAALDDRLLERAKAAASRSITTLKVKLSGDPRAFERELRALYALRDLCPDELLRLDVNGAWDVPTARESLRALVPLRLEFVEQPVQVGLLRTLGWCGVPWAIDESLADEEEWRALVSGPHGSGCGAVVIKPAVHGLRGALAIADRADRAGLGVVITHLFDGPIALAAACEVALALPIARSCGLDLHDGLAAWPDVKVLQRRQPAWVFPSGRPGIGIDPLPQA